MAINALLGRGHFDDAVNVQHLLLFYETINGDGPRTSLEVFRQPGRLVFIGRELVVVVVIGDIFVRSDLLSRREAVLLNTVDFGICLGDRRWGE